VTVSLHSEHPEEFGCAKKEEIWAKTASAPISWLRTRFTLPACCASEAQSQQLPILLSMSGYAMTAQIHALPAVSGLPLLFYLIFHCFSSPAPCPPSHDVHSLQHWAPQLPHGHQLHAGSLCSSTSSHPNFSVLPFLWLHPSEGAAGRCVPAMQSWGYGRAGSVVPWGNLQSTSCYYSLQQNNQHGLCNAVRWIEAA